MNTLFWAGTALLLALIAFVAVRHSPLWPRIVIFFKDSETIFWARAQVVIGAVAAAVTYVDPQLVAPIFPHGWAPWVILANGVATEWLRRRRDPELGE